MTPNQKAAIAIAIVVLIIFTVQILWVRFSYDKAISTYRKFEKKKNKDKGN